MYQSRIMYQSRDTYQSRIICKSHVICQSGIDHMPVTCHVPVMCHVPVRRPVPVTCKRTVKCQNIKYNYLITWLCHRNGKLRSMDSWTHTWTSRRNPMNTSRNMLHPAEASSGSKKKLVNIRKPQNKQFIANIPRGWGLNSLSTVSAQSH